MTISINQIQINKIGMREDSRQWWANDNNYYSQPRTIRLTHTAEEGWTLQDGRHRLEATKQRGAWWIEAEYEKWDEEGNVIESGRMMVTL